MSGRTTLKTYFLSGSSPSEANFADLIDSVLVLSEDLTDSISTSSSTIALSANAGNSLNNLISALDSRVVTLEGADNSFASNYYNKTEVDASISTINGLFNTLPYTGQIASIDAEILSIKSSITGLSLNTHSHNISDIAGLQSAIDTKATTTYVDNIAALLTQSINAIVPSDETAEVAQLQLYIDAINSVLSGLPDFSTKSDVGHTHSVANITDLTSVYYSKIQVDALFENVAPGAHNHTESEITDLDKYTQGAVDLKLTDHNNLRNNPHAVTKDQLGLGSVENLSVIDLFQTPQAQAFATDAELQEVNAININHVASTSNPHSVTKQQVSLGNVPNINFQSLLDAHLADSNPHEIDLTYFDVFSRAETDSRVVHYIDALRYAFKPTTPADGAGAIGDIAYHDSGLYFKFGATDWRQVISSKTFNDGSPESKFLIETPKLEVTTPDGVNLFSVDNTTNTTSINTTNVSIGGSTFNEFNVSDLFKIDKSTDRINISTSVVSIGGATNISNILNVEGDVSLGNSLNVSNLFSVDKTTNTTNISTSNISIGGATNIDNTLNVTGAVSLGGSTFNVAGNTTNISSTHVSLGGSTLNVNGQVSLASGMTTQGAVSISNTLNVSAHSILSTLRATTATVDSLDSGSGTIQTAGQLKGGATTVTSLSAGSGAISTTGTLSTGGATVTSLSAGNGSISTTGSLSTGPATITSLDTQEIWLGGVHGSTANNTVKWIRCAPMDWSGSVNPDTIAAISMGSDDANQDDGNIDFYTSLNENVNPTGTTSNLKHAMRISALGNVGIGTTTPGNYKLNVNGPVNASATTVTSLTSTGSISGKNLTLSGNLTVNGTTTSIDTTNLNIEDNFILINKNQTGTPAATLTSGIAVERGSASNAEIYWDETSDRWKVNTGGSVKTLAFVEDAYSQ